MYTFIVFVHQKFFNRYREVRRKMMKYLKGKNVLAAILCATMMLGIVPFTVFAANTDGNLYTKKQISASVQYLNQERTQAEITYSVPIGPQDVYKRQVKRRGASLELKPQ